MKNEFYIIGLAFASLTLSAFGNAEREFDEAFRSGRPLAANQAFLKLENERRELSPIRYFQAAEVSRQIGESAARRTRLSHFVKISKNWTDEVEQAAWELCDKSNDVDAFLLLASKTPQSLYLKKASWRLLDLCNKQKRSADFIKVAEASLKAFKDDNDRKPVYNNLAQMLREKTIFLSDKELQDFVMRYAPNDLSLLDGVFLARKDVFTSIWRLRLMASTGRLLSPVALDKIYEVGKDPQIRIEAANIAARFTPMAYDGHHSRHACEFLSLRVAVADLIFKGKTKEQISAALSAEFEKIASNENRPDNSKMANLLHWCGYVRLTMQDLERIKTKYPQFAGSKSNQTNVAKPTTPSELRLDAISSEMRQLKREAQQLAPQRAHTLFEEAAKVFKGRWAPSDKLESRLFFNIIKSYIDLCAYNSKSANIAVRNIANKLDLSNKDSLYQSVNNHQRFLYEARYEIKTLIEFVRAANDANFIINSVLDKGTDKLPFSVELFAKVNTDKAVEFLTRNWNINSPHLSNITPELASSIAIALFKGVECNKITNRRYISDLFNVARSTVRVKPDLANKYPLDKIANEVLDPKLDDGYHARLFLNLCASCGKVDPYLQKYISQLSRESKQVRLQQTVALLEEQAVTTFDDAKTGVPDRFTTLFVSHLIPTLKSYPTKHATQVYLCTNTTLAERVKAWGARTERKDKKETKVILDTFFLEMVRLKNAGARGFIDHAGWDSAGRVTLPYYRHVYQNGLDTTNVVLLAQVAHNFGRSSTVYSILPKDIIDILNRSKELGMWEYLYLVSSAIDGAQDKQVLATAARLRAEASTHLPGVYPVSEKDPLYPLYVAADEYLRNNFDRASELLTSNLIAFERDAVKLPPAFVAWAVDQMRIMRGKKDAMLLRARALATKLLVDEAKLTPDLAAAMLLVRAESYRDQQNFEAAKLEYQTIRNNPAYAKTPFGRKAMFRSVDLAIETGNSSSAEPTIELWLSQSDPDIQAQAHYFIARIAFDRKDYEECIKHLKDVFAIDFTHTDARLLHGKWKLATNNEVDETEVLVGSITDRTFVRPGQQLSITVQDRNLSVAGGGNTIPVEVRTIPGGDFEIVQLTPSSRDSGLFKGDIDVRLANSTVSNLVLEVTGNDTVTYTIAPSFLAARGLSQGKPKRLSVIDDARLAIGAGSAKMGAEDAAAQVEALVEGGADSGNSYRYFPLRPGNPLHIAVSDKDRSTGTANGSIKVNVKTTSGDLLSNVELKEVSVCSGIFRATVPTALPPPRAFASDTATGFNAGDAINSTHPGTWKSLADNQPVKWFEVDTMGSHLFSNVVVRMTTPEDITKIRLIGKLAKETCHLGSFPAASIDDRLGLRRQYAEKGGFRNEAAIREFMESASAPKLEAVNAISFVPRRGGVACVARYSGVFVTPEGMDFIRFKIMPRSNDASALKSLRVVVALDGETVFADSGTQLADALISLEPSVGVHRLEVFATAWNMSDAFDLLLDDVTTKKALPIPTEWFDVKRHPELSQHVADRAKIVQDKDGFTAIFNVPTRLRSIRWEFLGRRGPDVSISSISAIDADGKAILPVSSDFSDAQRNNTLEVAPGDRISVAYVDERTSRGTSRKIERSINSSFNDASVNFLFDNPNYIANQNERYHTAYRFVPGDNLVVSVKDFDLDMSDEADVVEAVVKSRSGGSINLKLIEQEPNTSDTEGVHSGVFLALLKTAAKGSGSKNALEVVDNDELSIEYLDRENTNPGVPVTRSAKISATRRATPVVKLFRSVVERVVDNSSQAKMRLEAIRRRSGNEEVNVIYRNMIYANPIDVDMTSATNAIVMNIDAPILVRVNDASRARHSESFLTLEAISSSQEELAKKEGVEPKKATVRMRLGAPFTGVSLRSGAETARVARQLGSFNGMIRVVVGTDETVAALYENSSKSQDSNEHSNILPVAGSDKVKLIIKDDNEVLAESEIVFASDAKIDLVDSSLTAERTAVHCGERFYIRVCDADCDVSDEPDRIKVTVKGVLSGYSRSVELCETLPHSGIFTGVVRPDILAKNSQTPANQGDIDGKSQNYDDRFPVKYGDRLEIKYVDEKPFSFEAAQTLCVTGTVHEGSDGNMRIFSKRFTDLDQAVLVQFRLSESLFEQAKEFRQRKQYEKSSDAIARGRFILEEALKNHPGTQHASQGEFLLANLAQELAAEVKESGDEEKSRRLYTEALSRFSTVLSTSPNGEYAPRAQYHKALCLEMLGDFKRAGEEYVKMTYLYPQSELVGDATVRLATHYYKNEKRYDIAARIYENFQKRFPTHTKASRALFMCGSCYIKQGDRVQKEFEQKVSQTLLSPKADQMYLKAMQAFEAVIEKYRNDKPEIRAQALYWAGDAALRRRDAKNAYLFFKRTVLEYPETEWARRARGMLLQESEKFKNME